MRNITGKNAENGTFWSTGTQGPGAQESARQLLYSPSISIYVCDCMLVQVGFNFDLGNENGKCT